MKKRLFAILLIAVLMLGCLAGCGEDAETTEISSAEKTGEETSAVTPAKYAYKANYIPMTTHEGDELSYCNSFCVSGDYAYYVGSYSIGTVKATDPVTGEEIIDPSTGKAYEYEEMADGLFRMELSSGTVTLMEGYTQPEIPEGWEGYSNLQGILPGKDGTIWVREFMNTYKYEVPENFDPETDEYYNYYVEGETRSELTQYSADGVKLQSVSLDFGDEFYVNEVYMHDDGYIFASDYQQVYVLDSTGKQVDTLTGENGWVELQQISGTEIGMMSHDAEGNSVLKLYDPAAKTMGEEITLARNAYNLMPGFGEYQYLYQTNDAVYGLKEDSQIGEKLFAWLDCDVDSNNVHEFYILSDGRVVAKEEIWSSTGNSCSLIIMEQVDASTLPKKQELVLGCMYLDYQIRPLIVNFNRTHDDVRIVVKDYSEYIADGTYEDAIQKLNTEILSGAGPDIIDVGNVPLQQYAAKGVFVDLWQLIDADPELSREDLMSHLFETMSVDEKLYYVTSSFSIQTAAVNSAIAAGRTSWTLEEVLEALDSLGEDAAIFGETDIKSDMLTQCLSFNLDRFIDWSTGQCSFDSEEFISMLEFANTFPAEFEYTEDYWMTAESEYSRIQNGKQLMSACYISSFDELQVQAALHGGDVTFIGFPTTDDGCGSTFMTHGGLAIASDCENIDAAWSFVREILLEKNQTADMWQFPTNKQAFDLLVEQAMTAQYEIDPETGLPAIDPETGDKIEISTSGIGYGDDFMVDIYSMKQHEYDAFMALYENCTNVYSYNETVMGIIQEEAEAYFNGQNTAEQTAGLIQNRLGLYIAEQG